MKSIYKIFLLLLAPVIFILIASSNGSPGGRTGSIGDNGQNCTGCHSGTPQSATNWITTDIPTSGYVPGQTYTITATGTHTGVVKFGFELTAENSAGAKVGTFIITNTTQTKLVNQNKAVTHLTAGTTPSGNTKTWSMNWTAPNPGVGAVTFSSALNAANGNGGTSGDVIYLTSTTAQEASPGIEVTFRVDMSEQTVSPLGVHIAGSFQGWDPGATEMTDTGNSIYAVTVSLPEGEYIEYKFVNGNAWGMDESVPPGCAVGGNRYLTVPAQNATLEAVCFGSCTICNPGNVNITFQVDMSNETVSPLGVHIAGSFQGWNPGGTPMTEIGNDVWAVTIELGIGAYYEYKFVNGNAWGMDETVPPQCASGWNRFITVPAVPTTLDAVCFGSCDPCGPPPVPVEITFRVDMTNETVSPDGVHIGGGFQGWNPGSTPMIYAGDNIYTYTTILPSGTYQEYKFVNGTTWEQSENLPPECSNSNNRFITVPQSNTVLEIVCYGECDPCGPPPVVVDVTFVVDLSEEIVSQQGVHLAGSFQGWDPASLEMTNTMEDIYQVTVSLLSGTYLEYKFINGDTFDGAEMVPEECGVDDGFGGYSRFYTVPDVNVTLPEVCFSSCTECSGVGIIQDLVNSTPGFYPNPAQDRLYFTNEADLIKVNIYSVDGKLVLAKFVANEALDISVLNRGLYFVRIETENEVSVTKLIIN